MIDQFLHPYSPDDQEMFDYQLRKSYKTYPYSIISVLAGYEHYLDEKDYLRALRRYFDFFEISVQYCSSVIISVLKHNNVEFDETLQQVSMKIVEKELSVGDWINSIFLVLLKKSKDLIPDDPLIMALLDSLSDSKGNILLGWSSKKEEEYKSLPYFRNTYYGHESLLSEAIYKDILVRIEPRLFTMLQAMAPLGKYTSFTLDKIVDDEKEVKKYTIRLLKGIQTGETIRISTQKKLEDGKYYMVRRELEFGDALQPADIIPITPFVIYLPYGKNNEEQKTTFLFQSVKAGNLRKMIYISPNMDAVRKETELFKDLFMSFLEDILGRSIIDKNYNIAIAKGKGWEEYLELLGSQTDLFLGQMKNVKKYDPELYVERKVIHRAWDQFTEMDDRRAFVLLGNAGAGKTNLICNLAEQMTGKKTAVLTYNSKIFSLTSLEGKLKEDFKEPKQNGQQIIEQLNKKALENKQHVYFLFDALNECLEYDGEKGSNGPVRLLQDIDKILVRKEFSAIKVLITCRTYTWEEAIRSEQASLNLTCYFTSDDITGQDDKETLSLKGFSEEEFKEAYPKYQQKFELKTRLETLLDPDYAFTRTRLEDPLMMSLSGQIYAGGHLPQHIRQFDSVRLFGARLEQLEKSTSGMQQVSILMEFTRMLRKRRTDGLRLKWLYQAFDDQASELHPLAIQLLQGSTYDWKLPIKALLDAGILRVEKSTREPELRFTFERFHEFMYAKVFVSDESDNLKEGLPIPPESYERELQEMRGYAVINGALRHALVMDYSFTKGDASTITTLANSNVYNAAPLVMSTLNSLIIDNYSEVCIIISQLLEYRKIESEPLAEEMVEKDKLIEEGNKGKNKLTKEDIEQLNRESDILAEKLQPVIQVRKIAIQVIYEIFKSPVFAKGLYEGLHSPFDLLWRAMSDPVARVRDNVSLYIYYISKYDVSIGIRILDHLSEQIMDTSMLSLVKGSKRKEFQQSFMEPAGRLSLLMVVEGLVERGDYELSQKVKDTWRAILKKLTLNFTLIKVVMPFLKFFLRRQATVQVAYVNNGIEYQHFWETIPETGASDDWHQDNFKALVPFLDPDKEGLEEYHAVISKAIDTGDAFSYFLIERLMVAQGWADWNRIKPLALEVAAKPEGHPMLDYMQMSMLYVLFHSIEKSDYAVEEAFAIFSKMTEEWSERCRGLFYAHKNDQANKGLPYKQYPLNWYGAAYCRHWGDGGTRPGDPYPLPVFRNLIDKAIEGKDKELLYYCLENIATLVTDFSRPVSAIQLFEYVISRIRHKKQIIDFDAIPAAREEHNKDLRTFLCGTIGTIKSYYPREVAYFIHNKLTNSDFPEMEQFREDLQAYNQSHESIADLLTHKFGNFIIWGLLHDKAVSRFFMDGFTNGAEVDDYFEWFDGIVRLSFNKLFDIKL
jgi:hypothetical protein